MPIADLHCHYPMHLLYREGRSADPALRELTRLRGRDRWRKLKAAALLLAARLLNFRRFGGGWRVSLDRLDAGDVRLVLSVLYLPDKEMDLDEWPDGSPEDGYFGALAAHLEAVEAHLIGPHPGGAAAKVVRTAAELTAPAQPREVRFVHCVEGGFHLGRSVEEIDARVEWLASRGVGYVTLAHLFWRQVATTAPALPFLSDGQYRRLFPQPDGLGLSDLGRAAVRAMRRHRVLVDVSHMSRAAIEETFDLLAQLDREHGLEPADYPVIATHAGYRFGEQSYMLDERTIERIASRGGVIGLIMAHHQLNDGLFRRPGGLARTLTAVRAQVDAIHRVTGSYDHVAIGSDLDGFIKPTVGGIQNADDLGKLVDSLREAYGEAAGKILHGNALRAFERAFAGRPAPAFVLPSPGSSS